ncbi:MULTISPECIES: hypothetical protein [Bacteria]|uniref:hypothetical protein n=1 Tax=Bacteria TaxID=2 RepID=UPI0037026149
MKNFIEREDLTTDMAPKQEWLKRNGFHGILFIESPNKSDFENLITLMSISSRPTFNITHAQFDDDFSFSSVGSADATFDEFFNFGHEEVFIEVIFSSARYVIWIPSEHKFYGIFGAPACLNNIFGTDTNSLKSEILHFAYEPFFNKRTKNYIMSAVDAYFTVK